MALVGKWTKIEYIQSETEKETIKVDHPLDLPEYDLSFSKAGTTEEIEVPKQITIEKVYENAYVVVHSINSWKEKIDNTTKSLFNITYRVYENKEDRINNYNLFILQDALTGQEIDYGLYENEIQQAYKIINNTQGFEQLIND
jgi:hypothetical protein